MDTPELTVRRYYECFNERRITEAAALFVDDAVVQHLLFEPLRGSEGWTWFAQAWLQAFPDARMDIRHIEKRDDELCEVDLVTTGTHLGTLSMGVYRFNPSGAVATLPMRHLLECRDGRIVFSSLSFDMHQFIQLLVPIDLPALKLRLGHICSLSDELDRAHGDSSWLREIVQRLGMELDAARKILRPYFYR